MEAIHDPGPSSVSWVARLVEVLQPLTVRADRLAVDNRSKCAVEVAHMVMSVALLDHEMVAR